MDGGGIDFVEADFGSEAGMQSPEMKYEKSAAEWQKWAEKSDRAPIGPVLLIVGSVLLMILFPWLAETALKAKMQPPAGQEVQQSEVPQPPGGMPQQTAGMLQQAAPMPQQAQQYQPSQTQRIYGSAPAYDARFGRPNR